MPLSDVAGPLAKCAKGGGQRSCAGLESSIFYPPTEEESGRAKAVCAECPVRQDCLEFAISVREKEGVYFVKTSDLTPFYSLRRRDLVGHEALETI